MSETVFAAFTLLLIRHYLQARKARMYSLPCICCLPASMKAHAFARAGPRQRRPLLSRQLLL